MAGIVKRFKGAGWWTNLISAIVGIATNWGLIVSVLFGVAAWAWRDAFKVLADPHVQLGGSVFLWSLWTYIAMSFLYRIHTGIKTIPYVDYAFGIIIEGLGINVDTTREGNIQPTLQFRNVVNAAIKYQIKDVRVIINGRTHPDALILPVIIPRLGQKGLGTGLFKKSEFTGKDKYEGFLDVTIEYGPYDGKPVRKMRIKAKLFIQPPPSPNGTWGFGNELISEEDTPI
jgi:hypothetical protein